MKKHTGIRRIMHACMYSWHGLKSALSCETAFLQEFIVAVLLGVSSFYLDVSAYERLAMLASLVVVLIVELLNSAIECVTDRIGFNHHTLAGRAKDYGSLAVFFSIMIAVLVWLGILL